MKNLKCVLKKYRLFLETEDFFSMFRCMKCPQSFSHQKAYHEHLRSHAQVSYLNFSFSLRLKEVFSYLRLIQRM
jgi:uncharacterized C2H2 Zn-finger protein